MSVTPQSTISVVVTCYNQARYLGEAIGSVLAQGRAPSEVVVVDDGSTDDTAAVVARHPAARYIRQRNEGVAGARNRGLRETTGDYVVFLDGDDRLLPGALEAGARSLDARPDCAFAFGRCNLVAADGSPIPTAHDPVIEDEHYLRLLRSNYIWMPAKVMYRRAALERAGGFDPWADHAGDYHLYLTLARTSPVHCHGEIVAEWRQHDANTSRNSALMLKSSQKVLRAQRRYVRGDRRAEEALRAGLRYWQEFYGDPIVERVRAEVRRGHWGRAALCALPLLRHSPRTCALQLARKLRHAVAARGGETV